MNRRRTKGSDGDTGSDFQPDPDATDENGDDDLDISSSRPIEGGGLSVVISFRDYHNIKLIKYEQSEPVQGVSASSKRSRPERPKRPSNRNPSKVDQQDPKVPSKGLSSLKSKAIPHEFKQPGSRPSFDTVEKIIDYLRDGIKALEVSRRETFEAALRRATLRANVAEKKRDDISQQCADELKWIFDQVQRLGDLQVREVQKLEDARNAQRVQTERIRDMTVKKYGDMTVDDMKQTVEKLEEILEANETMEKKYDEAMVLSKMISEAVNAFLAQPRGVFH